MTRDFASFSVRLLGASLRDRPDLDAAIAIFTRNTSPLLRTQANQIRQKIRKPNNPHGAFYFVAFYRGDTVIGFAMFGYYPRTRLIAIDHLVIAEDQRGESAFQIFAHLIRDLIDNIGVEVDFVIAEVERRNQFGGEQTGGQELVRLLGQVGFGEVHMDYMIPNMEPKTNIKGYQGALMIRGTQKIYNIRRDDLVDLYRTIIYEHYLPWFSDFLGAETECYRNYLDDVFAEFQEQLKDTPIVRVNGEAIDQLMPQTRLPSQRTPEMRAILFSGTLAICGGVLVSVAFALKVQISLLPLVAIVMLALFSGVVAVSSGRAYDVFELALSNLPGGKRRSRYRRAALSQESNVKRRPRRPRERPSSHDESGDTVC